MLRVTIDAPVSLDRAVNIQEYAYALGSHVERANSAAVAFDFEDVANAQKFTSTLVGMNISFHVGHSPQSCCWAGEGCCK